MTTPITPGVPAPIAIPRWTWLALLAAAFMVEAITVDNGLLLGQVAENAHEFFHDARHLTGVPCH